VAFWNLGTIELEEFRPGIMSKAEIGDNLIMDFVPSLRDGCGALIGGLNRAQPDFD